MNLSTADRHRILRETAAILATPRRAKPAAAPAPHPATPVVEVSESEAAMLQRSEAIFAASPGLRLTFGTAEAFGRHCLKTARHEVIRS